MVNMAIMAHVALLPDPPENPAIIPPPHAQLPKMPDEYTFLSQYKKDFAK
jgi:hypothetical protein